MSGVTGYLIACLGTDASLKMAAVVMLVRRVLESCPSQRPILFSILLVIQLGEKGRIRHHNATLEGYGVA